MQNTSSDKIELEQKKLSREEKLKIWIDQKQKEKNLQKLLKRQPPERFENMLRKYPTQLIQNEKKLSNSSKQGSVSCSKENRRSSVGYYNEYRPPDSERKLLSEKKIKSNELTNKESVKKRLFNDKKGNEGIENLGLPNGEVTLDSDAINQNENRFDEHQYNIDASFSLNQKSDTPLCLESFIQNIGVLKIGNNLNIIATCGEGDTILNSALFWRKCVEIQMNTDPSPIHFLVEQVKLRGLENDPDLHDLLENYPDFDKNQTCPINNPISEFQDQTNNGEDLKQLHINLKEETPFYPNEKDDIKIKEPMPPEASTNSKIKIKEEDISQENNEDLSRKSVNLKRKNIEIYGKQIQLGLKSEDLSEIKTDLINSERTKEQRKRVKLEESAVKIDLSSIFVNDLVEETPNKKVLEDDEPEVEEIKNKTAANLIKEFQNSYKNNVKEYGSFFSYQLSRASEKQKRTLGSEYVLTPVRQSKRISSKQQFKKEGQSNELNIQGLETSEIPYISNMNETLFKPKDKKSKDIHKQLLQIKKELSEKGSIASKQNPSDAGEGEDFDFKEESIENNNNKIIIEFQSENQKNEIEPLFVINDVEIKKVIDPNINNNGNFALLEITEKSMNELGFETNRVVTPLKQIQEEIREQASQDLETIEEYRRYSLGYIAHIKDIKDRISLGAGKKN